jgi:hypothetical protein
VRPVAGPVVPLTVTPGNSEELLGGAGSQPMHSDATANRVLVKGEPVPAPPGRADDFVWPLGSDGKSVAPAAGAPATEAPAANAVARTEPPAAAAKPSEEPKRGGTAAKTSQTTGVKPRLDRPVETRPRPSQGDVPRPPGAIPQSGGFYGWQR